MNGTKNEHLTVYGKLCRKYRIDKGWTMKDAAANLGCRQSFLSQIETTKTKQRITKKGEIRNDNVSPNFDFLMKSIEVYELNPVEKLDFLFKVLIDIEKLEIPLKNDNPQLREKFITFLVVFLLDYKGNEYPKENIWSKTSELWKWLKRSYSIAGEDPLQ